MQPQVLACLPQHWMQRGVVKESVTVCVCVCSKLWAQSWVMPLKARVWCRAGSTSSSFPALCCYYETGWLTSRAHPAQGPLSQTASLCVSLITACWDPHSSLSPLKFSTSSLHSSHFLLLPAEWVAEICFRPRWSFRAQAHFENVFYEVHVFFGGDEITHDKVVMNPERVLQGLFTTFPEIIVVVTKDIWVVNVEKLVVGLD